MEVLSTEEGIKNRNGVAVMIINTIGIICFMFALCGDCIYYKYQGLMETYSLVTVIIGAAIIIVLGKIAMLLMERLSRDERYSHGIVDILTGNVIGIFIGIFAVGKKQMVAENPELPVAVILMNVIIVFGYLYCKSKGVEKDVE